MIESFHFLRPWWLLALLPLVMLLVLQHRQRHQAGSWRAVCDPALLPYLLLDPSVQRRRRSLLPVGIAGLLAILALAGPAWRELPQPLFQDRAPLVIALDLSRSMDATDIQPSRLVRARYKLLDILKQRREGETALLVYAAQPFLVTPLTEDSETIAAQVNSLTTAIMPSQGSRPDLALQKGIELLQQAGTNEGQLLFITDGIDSSRLQQMLSTVDDAYPINILAVGTPEGAPIPLESGGFLKDEQGEILIPQLQRQQLQQLAGRSGGLYVELRSDDQDIAQLLAATDRSTQRQEQQQSQLTANRWYEEGPWLLLLLLPLAALGFRQGYLLIALALLLPIPPPATAADWTGLWQRPDQQAMARLQADDPAAAAALFEDPRWQAAARYRAGEYQQSLDALKGLDDAEANYNRGNALARLGRYPEAIAAYEKALEQSPEDADARFNRDLLQQKMKQQQQKQEQEQEQQNNQQQNDQQDQQDQQGEQDQQQQKGQQQGQQSKAGEQGEQSAEQQPQPSDGEPSSDSSAPSAADQQQPSPGEEAKADQPQPAEPSEADEKEADAALAQPQDADPSEQEGAQSAPQGAVEEEQRKPVDEATERWLRRIPDDPAGLLMRKFRYQYQRQYQGRSEPRKW